MPEDSVVEPGRRSTGRTLAAVAGIFASVATIATAAAALAGVFSSSASSPKPGPAPPVTVPVVPAGSDAASSATGPTLAQFGRRASAVCRRFGPPAEQYYAAMQQGMQAYNFATTASAAQAWAATLAQMTTGLDGLPPPTGREADAARLVANLKEARDDAFNLAAAAAAQNPGAVNQSIVSFQRTFSEFIALARSLDAADCAAL
jgi:hypothetical protein